MKIRTQASAPAYECSCGQHKDTEPDLYAHMRQANAEAATSFRHYLVNR